MTIRYANDLKLTDMARVVTNYVAELNTCLTNGQLDAAFLIAEDLRSRLEDLQWRLNDIKYGRTDEARKSCAE